MILTYKAERATSPHKRAPSIVGLLAAAVSLVCVEAFLHPVHAAEDERAEIKLLVQADKIGEARRLLNLTDAPGKHHKIYLVETPHFDLNKFGLILQLRAEANDWMEVTVKFNPKDSSRPINDEWQGKLEKEPEWLVGKGQTVWYSLKQNLGGAERINHPDENLDILFTDEQKTLFTQVVNHQTNIAELHALGPIAADIWEWSEEAADDKISAELWTFGNKQLLELSRKANTANLKAEADKFEQALKRKGIEVESDPEDRTRKALAYYSHLTHAKPDHADPAHADFTPATTADARTEDLLEIIKTQRVVIKKLKDSIREQKPKEGSSEPPE